MARRGAGAIGWLIVIGVVAAWLSQTAEHPSPSQISAAPSGSQIPSTSAKSRPRAITLFTTADLRLRGGPNTDSRIIKTLKRGSSVVSHQIQGVWHKVTAGGQQGWVHGDYLATTPPAAVAKPKLNAPLLGQNFNCTVPIPTLKDQMIRESIARYPGSCPCPYNVDRGGRRCGGRSAWSKPGGYSPLCYPSDVTPDMVREFCEVLKLRGRGG